MAFEDRVADAQADANIGNKVSWINVQNNFSLGCCGIIEPMLVLLFSIRCTK